MNKYELCTDCMLYAVNGDLPTDSDNSRDRAIRTGVHALGQHLVPNFGDNHNEFSWAQCDACGSTLGGARFQFVTLENVVVFDPPDVLRAQQDEIKTLKQYIFRLENWRREGEELFEGYKWNVMFMLGKWWAERPWRNRT